jgi:hypothetical protein
MSGLSKVPIAQTVDAYVVSLFVYDEDDDARKPTITISINTETQVQKRLALGADERDVRWNYAYLQQDPLAIIGSEFNDPEGAALRRPWLEALGLWYSDQDIARDPSEFDEQIPRIEREIWTLAVRLGRRLHDAGVIERTFSRPIPVIVHELEYYDEIATLNKEVNPGPLIAAFLDWIER